MAVPAVAGRRAQRLSVSADAAPLASITIRRFGRSHLWIVAALAAVALFSRVYTTNSLAGEPTSDEYLYAVHARDLARDWASGKTVSLEDLSVEGRSVAVESAALSFVIPWDPLTVGRTMQALFNALCIPATFVLGRKIGLTRSAAAVGALLLMAVPEFQELAWRFWTDSQATLVILVYLTSVVSFMRRPSIVSGGLGVLCLALLLLTKESAAVTFTPFLVLAAAIPASQRLTASGRVYAAVAAALVLAVFIGLAILVARAPADLARNALVQRTFGAAPLVFNSIRDAIPKVPDYSQSLVSLIGPRELGTGFLWAVLIGFVWLVAQSVVSVMSARPRLSPWVLGWILAALVWAPAMITPARDVASLGLSDPWIAVAAGGLMVAVGTVELYLRNSRRTGWGLVLIGLVVLAVLSERLVIAATPKVSNAALTFRSLMPIIPLFALVAGGGVWAAAGALALLVPSSRSARAAIAIVAGALLVVFWSPLVRERLSPQPLLGRVADRGADPDTPQGLRVETFVQAQGWLQTNLQPDDMILTGVGILRHVAWYADLGVDGMNNLIDLGSQPCPPRCDEEARAYVLDRVGPHGVSYVIDFNVNWLDPGGEKSRQWRTTFEILASKPNLEVAYLQRDKFGFPVFYVIRNHGYALAPGH
jgi:Dolichyl-phosphate-mannose-protein mannosyltransferase